MQTPDSQQIIKRFFEVLAELKKRKVIRGKKTFTDKYNINNRNFWQLEQDKSRDIMQLAWLAYLVADFKISAQWLLTGEGDIFTEEPPKRYSFKNTKRK